MACGCPQDGGFDELYDDLLAPTPLASNNAGLIGRMNSPYSPHPPPASLARSHSTAVTPPQTCTKGSEGYIKTTSAGALGGVVTQVQASPVELAKLRKQVQHLQEHKAKYLKEREILIRNMSCIFKTAQEELGRKTREISRLQQELEEVRSKKQQQYHENRISPGKLKAGGSAGALHGANYKHGSIKRTGKTVCRTPLQPRADGESKEHEPGKGLPRASWSDCKGSVNTKGCRQQQGARPGSPEFKVFADREYKRRVPECHRSPSDRHNAKRMKLVN